MNEEALARLAASRNLGTLATLKRDGRPQLSNVSFTYDVRSRLARVSSTDDRAKVKNLRRDSRASLVVSSRDGWSYAVLEGDVELTPVAERPDDGAVDELVEVYRQISGGEHPDWQEFREAMVAERRLVVRLRVGRLYGVVR